MSHHTVERADATSTGMPSIGRRYEVGGKHLYLNRTGSGSPAVVFLPGAGLVGLDYLNIENDIATFTTGVVYDRAGTGWSDPASLARSAEEVVEELRNLLHTADIPGPYILVGHSMGGLLARRYAQLHPGEVAGLLMMESGHEDYPDYTPKGLTGPMATLRMIGPSLKVMVHFRSFYRNLFEHMLAQWPDVVREQLVDYHLRTWRSSMQEHKNMEDSLYDELRSGGPTPDVPMIVLTAMGIDPFQAAIMPVRLLRESNELKLQLYTELAASVPRGELRVVENAGHTTIHTERPDVVVQAIRDLVERVNGAPA